MTVVCAVQARMGSTRLPGKVLADLGNRPMLAFMLDRLRSLAVDHLVVATSTRPQDDAVADVSAAAGVEVVRGSESDVLSRYCAVLDTFPADSVVRLTGDCPLVDPEIIQGVLELHRARGAEYTSNVLPRTFPKGLDVEVVDAAALRQAADESVDPGEREHVTPFIYRRPERFRLANFSNPEHLGDERWTVDTPADLALVRQVVDRLGSAPGYGWRDVLGTLGRRHTVDPDVLRLRLARPSDSATFLALRNEPLVVGFSTTNATVDPDTHRRWFAARLDDPASRLWVGELGGAVVGTLRLQVTGGVGEVSIAVDLRCRHQGLGRRMLLAGQERVADDWQIVALEAMVHPLNEASLRAFAGVGFSPAGSRRNFVVLQWPKQAGGPPAGGAGMDRAGEPGLELTGGEGPRARPC
ncbi:MAG: GNAT family N-acetyltransferase [Actinomycetota bacterium]|nr:GNAT family N-acetyltransferase [Actinomycetota bacterium]